ncbi:MAG: YicC/YloC family endoribonuclease [Thermodesulfovibrionales bacterium]|nr:YicC/YloC family endoribonuclease [Thermodesulfovibrionales bacterium]
MTGFGRAEKNGFRVEIRSLNHRFIDISMKTPPFLSQYDIPLRNILKEKFNRGRFDVNVSTDNHKLIQVKINKEMARKIYNAFQELQEELVIPGQIGIDTLAGYKELFVEEEPKYDIDALYDAFYEAVSNLETMRLREGELISKELQKRAESLNLINDKIKSLTPHLFESCRKRFSERLGLILEAGEMDSTKVMQEAVIMAEKLDISEEVNRIENHIKQFIETLGEGNVIGRKLDFLLQEIGREVNTTASKSSDYTISSLTVDMKIEIEKMREQVQNIQ